MRVHEFGFNVGGPIARDRAFFFFNYEEERQPGTSSVVRDVLTDPARRGDFSYVRQDNGQVARVNLFDMTGIAPDPAIQSLVDSTPGPNDSSVGDGRNTAGYRFNSPDDSDARWLVFRGDYVMNPRHSVSGSLRWELHTVPEETQGLALLPVGGAEAVLDPNAVVDFAGSAHGRPFFNSDRNNFAPSAVVGGWNLSGFVRVHSGEPISIVSGRGTVNRGSRAFVNTVHLRGIDAEELQRQTGVFRLEDGRVSLFESWSLRPPHEMIVACSRRSGAGRAGGEVRQQPCAKAFYHV